MDAQGRYVEIREDPLEDLSRYLEVHSRFESWTILDVHQDVQVIWRKRVAA